VTSARGAMPGHLPSHRGAPASPCSSEAPQERCRPRCGCTRRNCAPHTAGRLHRQPTPLPLRAAQWRPPLRKHRPWPPFRGPLARRPPVPVWPQPATPARRAARRRMRRRLRAPPRRCPGGRGSPCPSPRARRAGTATRRSGTCTCGWWRRAGSCLSSARAASRWGRPTPAPSWRWRRGSTSSGA